MVGFGLKLEDNIVDRWRDHYINYKKLTKFLKNKSSSFLNVRAIGQSGRSSESLECLDDFISKFEELVQAEINKVEAFFVGHISELAHEVGLLEERLTKKIFESVDVEESKQSISKDFDNSIDEKNHLLKRCSSDGKNSGTFFPTDNIQSADEHEIGQSPQNHGRVEAGSTGNIISNLVPFKRRRSRQQSLGETRHNSLNEILTVTRRRAVRRDLPILLPEVATYSPQTIESIRSTLQDLYRDLSLLHNFAILNYTGFVKILKKFNKEGGTTRGEDILKSVGDTCFGRACGLGDMEYREVSRLQRKMEGVFAVIFCGGNKTQAKGLLLQKRSESHMDWRQLQLGYRLGVALMLLVWVIWDCVVQVAKFKSESVLTTPAFPVFRAIGGLLLLQWCWVVMIIVWTRARVNFIYIFELDPVSVRPWLVLISEAVNNSIWYLVLLLIYFKVLVQGFPEIIPAGSYPLIGFCLLIFRLLSPWGNRKRMWGSVLTVLQSPFSEVNFYTVFVGDVLTSMVKIFIDLGWSICYFLSGDVWTDTSANYIEKAESMHQQQMRQQQQQQLYQQSSGDGGGDGGSGSGGMFLFFTSLASGSSGAGGLSYITPQEGVHEHEHIHGNDHGYSYSSGDSGDGDGGGGGGGGGGSFSSTEALQSSLVYGRIILPLICIIPVWCRFQQCLRRYRDTGKRFPNLVNGGKYAVSLTVTLFASLHPFYEFLTDRRNIMFRCWGYQFDVFALFWLSMFVVSALYSYAWDVAMDWSFFARTKDGHFFHGVRRMYRYLALYYLAAVFDLFLRFLWVSSLIPPSSKFSALLPAYISPLVMVLELCRRTFWAFFRLENEHLGNTQGYRRVDFIPLLYDSETKHKYAPTPSDREQDQYKGWKIIAETSVILGIVIAFSLGAILSK